MANLITIDQLLESVDLDFEPRFVTKDKNGLVYICEQQPIQLETIWYPDCKYGLYSHLKLAEFDGKDWTECIYEVLRKTTGKIEKLDVGYKDSFKIKDWQDIAWTVERTINKLVDAVNELKGAKNE